MRTGSAVLSLSLPRGAPHTGIHMDLPDNSLSRGQHSFALVAQAFGTALGTQKALDIHPIRCVF